MLDKTADSFITKIESLEKLVESEKWTDAEKQLNNIQEKWSKTEKWIASFVDHEEIDSIKITLAKLSQYVHRKEATDFMAESAVLKLLIKHIPGKEKPKLQNLL